jgi:hypothetical protein
MRLNSTSRNGLWRFLLTRYLLVFAAANLLWESIQLPLYTISQSGSVATQAYAVIHCTIGDVLIALLSLVAAMAVFLPIGRSERAALLLAWGLAISYTMFSEWFNTRISFAWQYADVMPTILGIGLSPLVQWILIPPVCYLLANRTLHHRQKHQQI